MEKKEFKAVELKVQSEILKSVLSELADMVPNSDIGNDYRGILFMETIASNISKEAVEEEANENDIPQEKLEEAMKELENIRKEDADIFLLRY